MNTTENGVGKASSPPPFLLEKEEVDKCLKSLSDGWRVIDGHHLEKEFQFRNFDEALDFTNQVGEIAYAQDHHPELCVAYGSTKVKIWTHKVDGLTEKDFLLAVKVDEVVK